MASPGGKPPLIQRYRIWPLLSHNPCSGPDRGAGHGTPRFHNFTRGATGGWPSVLRALQKAMPVIGYLSSQSAEALAPILPAFRDGLKEAGYIEGRDVSIEFAWAAGQYDKLPALAEDLVRQQVAVIV